MLFGLRSPHTRLPEQSLPQLPQLPLSLRTSRSQPSSALGAAGSRQLSQPSWQVGVQTPLLHSRDATLLPEQTRPHAPQFSGSASVFTSQPLVPGCPRSPSQSLYPAEHEVTMHCPPMQLSLLPQGLLQLPQCAPLISRSVSQPLLVVLSQSPQPASQAGVHVPPVQLSAATLLVEHAASQRPQW